MKTPCRQTSRPQAPSLQELLHHYACRAVHFSGDANASYERHVMFDHVVAPEAASLRERFEAVARSLRDLLVQRWLQTDATYDRANPKQVYYLSMEFLIGCSLTNNLSNLLVEPIVREVLQHEGLGLVDLAASVQTQAQVSALYRHPAAWARKAIRNVGHAGTFSSDGTIADYASDIWQAQPCPVE